MTNDGSNSNTKIDTLLILVILILFINLFFVYKYVEFNNKINMVQREIENAEVPLLNGAESSDTTVSAVAVADSVMPAVDTTIIGPKTQVKQLPGQPKEKLKRWE